MPNATGFGVVLPNELRLVLRQLAAARAFFLASAATIALGVGMTTAVSAFVRTVLSPPSGIRTEGLANLYHFPQGSAPMVSFSWPDYVDLRERQTAFDEIAGWSPIREVFSTGELSGSGFGEVVTGNYFDVLGVSAVLGRLLQPADDIPGSPAAVVISHALWRNSFSGDATVLGRTIKINGVTAEIVGVANPSFKGLFNGGLIPTVAWLSTGVGRVLPAGSGVSFDANDRDKRWVMLCGRLAQGITIAAAQAQVATIGQQLDTTSPLKADQSRKVSAPYQVRRQWTIRPTADVVVVAGVPESTVRTLMTSLIVATGLLALVTFTNLSSLMLARGARREAATSVRIALGAQTKQLCVDVITECLIICVSGGALGLAVALALVKVTTLGFSIGGGVVVSVTPSADWQVVVLGLGVTVAAFMCAGIGPLLQVARTDVRGLLASQANLGLAPRWKGRRALLVAQVASSAVLLTIALVGVAQVASRARSNGDIDLRQLAFLNIDFPSQGYEQGRTRDVVHRLLSEGSPVPGLRAIAVMSKLPTALMSLPDATIRRGGASPVSARVSMVSASADVFGVLDLTIVRGRGFDKRETESSTPVVVVDTECARILFATDEPTGQQIELETISGVSNRPTTHIATVIGIVRRAGQGGMAVYLPWVQNYSGRVSIVARTASDPASAVAALRGRLAYIDDGVAVTEAVTGRDLTAQSSVFYRAIGDYCFCLGAVILAVALVGLHGVLSQVVACRTRELGIRAALGASGSDLRGLILAEGLKPVLLGSVIGLAAGMGTLRLLRYASLFADSSLDGWIVIAVILLFGVTGWIACYWPAYAASRVQPTTLLRS